MHSRIPFSNSAAENWLFLCRCKCQFPFHAFRTKNIHPYRLSTKLKMLCKRIADNAPRNDVCTKREGSTRLWGLKRERILKGRVILGVHVRLKWNVRQPIQNRSWRHLFLKDIQRSYYFALLSAKLRGGLLIDVCWGLVQAFRYRNNIYLPSITVTKYFFMFHRSAEL